MPRLRSCATPLAEGKRQIDLAYLRRHKMLEPVRDLARLKTIRWPADHTEPAGEVVVIPKPDSVTFIRRDASGDIGKLRAPFVRTNLTFGERKRFACPACAKACRVLYVLENLNGLRCRKCSGLRYLTQYERTAGGRDMEKARKIRIRLGWPSDQPMPPPKPQRTRWRRYRAMVSAVFQLEQSGLAELGAKICGMRSSIESRSRVA